MAANLHFDRARKLLLLAGAASLMLAGFALPASALETIAPTSVRAPVGDTCPALTGIKYPWLSCRANEHGGVTLMLPSQPAPMECNWRLPTGECAASEEEWGIVPMIPRSID